MKWHMCPCYVPLEAQVAQMDGNVAVFQNTKMVMTRKEAPTVIRPHRIQI